MRLLLSIFAALPLKVHYFNARWIAFLLRSVFRYRRDVVMINLSRAFPEKKYGELKQICNDFYKHLSRVIVEAIWFSGCDAERLKKARIVRVENPELITGIYKETPSVVVLEGHFGNWELSGGIEYYNDSDPDFPVNEKTCCVIHKALSNKKWEKIFKKMRTAPLHDPDNYEGYLESNNVLRYMLSHKDEKKFYKMIADQSPYDGSSKKLIIDFLNQRTYVMTAAVAVAHRLGMSVVYSSMMRESTGKYRITYHLICTDASKMSIEDITGRFFELLENDIIAQPDSYLWSHKRWKLKIKETSVQND